MSDKLNKLYAELEKANEAENPHRDGILEMVTLNKQFQLALNRCIKECLIAYHDAGVETVEYEHDWLESCEEIVTIAIVDLVKHHLVKKGS